MLLALALLALQGSADADRPNRERDLVVPLELSAADAGWIEGRGPAGLYEHVVELGGTLHVWARSEVDLALRVEDMEQGLVLAQDDDSGGGTTPYAAIEVRPGMALAVLVAAAAGASEGTVELHLHTALADDATARLSERNNRATVLHQQGDLKGALELAQAVLETMERTLPPEHPQLLITRSNAAAIRASLGDLEGALELQVACLEAYQRVLPDEHPILLMARNNLAATQSRLGDREGAHAQLEEILAISERIHPDDHPDLLTARSNLSVARSQVGDFEGARELQERVLAILEASLPPEDMRVLTARYDWILTRFEQGERAAAEDLRELVSVLDERLAPDQPFLLAAKGSLGLMLQMVGETDAAVALNEEVLAACREFVPADPLRRIQAELNLAESLRAQGDLQEALALQRPALERLEEIQGASDPGVIAIRGDLAATLVALEEHERVRDEVRRLLTGLLEHADDLRLDAPRLARARALEALRALRGALAMTDDESLNSLFLDALESLRAASIARSDEAGSLASSPELEELRRRLAVQGRRLNELAYAAPEDVDGIEAWRAELVRAAEERDRIARELRAGLAGTGVAIEAPTIERIAAALEPGTVFISFFRGSTDVLAGALGSSRDDADALVAFLVTSEGTVHRLALGDCAELEARVADWRAAIGRPIEGSAGEETARGVGGIGGVDARAAASAERELATGLALRERLLDPCLAAFPERRPRAMLFVLDDFLHLLPIDALPWDAESRVGDVLDVRTEVSAAHVPDAVRETGAHGVLAVGGADYGPDAATPRGAPGTWRLTGHTFEPLPETQGEVEAIAALARRFRAGSEPTLLIGSAATREALIEGASSARFLHIATHGWFLPETVLSMRDRGREDRSLFERAERSIKGFAPQTLCGLALAGANGGSAAGGILTAEELGTLDLTGCELVVLSACETNVGLRRAGQGVQSLQAALHAAGARSAVTSLWRVEDASTRELMERFYTGLWERGLGKAEALWQAKRAMREAGHPTRDWAGWILTGEPD